MAGGLERCDVGKGRSPGAVQATRPAFLEARPGTSHENGADCTNNADLARAVTVMQSFMLKKGLINSSLTEQEMQELLQENDGPLKQATAEQPDPANEMQHNPSPLIRVEQA